MLFTYMNNLRKYIQTVLEETFGHTTVVGQPTQLPRAIEMPELGFIIAPKKHYGSDGISWNILTNDFDNKIIAVLSVDKVLHYDGIKRKIPKLNNHIKFPGTPQEAAKYVWDKMHNTEWKKAHRNS